MKKKSFYKQGFFIPRNREKYKGHTPLKYRSSWELALCMWADKNPAVIQWGLESAIVPYVDPTRVNAQSKATVHRYIIDFTMIIKDRTGQLTKYYIEVKPKKETVQPERGNKREATYVAEVLTFERNKAKWKAATEFAHSKGAKFMILTEDHLSI